MNKPRTKLSSIKKFVISTFKNGDRPGSIEIWGKVQGALKSSKPVRIMIINDQNQMFDKDGNWFEDDVK